MMIPPHLASHQSQGIAPQEPVAQYEWGSLKNFFYLILDWKTREAAVIDPPKDLSVVLGSLNQHGFTLRTCLLTHTHHDHVAGIPGVLAQTQDVAVHFHPGDEFRLTRLLAEYPANRFVRLKDQDLLQVGELNVRVLHTPGHSAGEVCYLLEVPGGRYLFSGDTLFIRDCGRTDFDTGSDESMFESLQKIKSLPKDLVILPGHHYAQECSSLLSEELKRSPPLLCRTVDDLKNLP